MKVEGVITRQHLSSAVARRNATLATTRPTIELRYMCAAATPWREASSGSHVHQPEAASAANLVRARARAGARAGAGARARSNPNQRPPQTRAGRRAASST